MRQAAEVARYLTLTYADLNQEVLGALFLNGCYRLLACREIYRGTLTHAAVEPRAILKEAIRVATSSRAARTSSSRDAWSKPPRPLGSRSRTT